MVKRHIQFFIAIWFTLPPPLKKKIMWAIQVIYKYIELQVN